LHTIERVRSWLGDLTAHRSEEMQSRLDARNVRKSLRTREEMQS
jgi:hypothetical protein